MTEGPTAASNPAAEIDLPGGPADALASLSYEQARAALERVVAALESSTVNLEQSLTLFERGNALADICQGFLDGARARVEAARPQL